MSAPTLVWLRSDLRLADNPALHAASAAGGPVIAVHIEATDPSLRPLGGASRWWLHHSLRDLAASLAQHGIGFETLRGVTEAVLLDAVGRLGATAVHWNRRYGPAERELDAAVKQALRAQGVEATSHAGNVLAEPFDIATKSGTPFAVFTPFWKAVKEREIPPPLPAPSPHTPIGQHDADAAYVAPAWSGKLAPHWQIGEAAAQAALVHFIDEIVGGYAEGRDFFDREVTSRLSPHLAFGEISARQIWAFARHAAARHPNKAADIEKFLSELAWRDFYIHQLYHRADIATVPMQSKYAALNWRHAPDELTAWQRGETGVPVVDAGMRELWQTGYMHNRVRMIVASFLTKNLLIDWREGERWFWDCLVDADPASNPGNWQWVAGCGNDAAPYFRIFNPESQAEKFDPDGRYVRRWAPAPRRPIVDLKQSRERALAAFAAL